MRPSRYLLAGLAAWCLLALLLSLSQLVESWSLDLAGIWKFFGFALLGLSVLDALRWRELRNLSVERQLPGSMALGQQYKILLSISNQNKGPVRLIVSDHAPQQLNAQGLPLDVSIEGESQAQIQYRVYPTRRGLADFPGVELLVDSRWKLWQFRLRLPCRSQAKVYPNFASIAHFDLLGRDQQIAQLGVHMTPKRGQGMDFHQLREYRQGDPLRQLDWKASSRHSKLISKDYREERDQDVIFLLDSGRRMRAKDGELSHFDHSLNALLLLSYVALKQGDAVGLLSFAGSERWVPPVKGGGGVNRLMNQVYDLFSSTETSDYLAAAESFSARHRKRALVILITNLRGEDSDDLSTAVKLLSERHLVMVASLREQVLDDQLVEPVVDQESALTYAATLDTLGRRARLLERMRLRKMVVVDSLPQSLHIDLINQYMALKRSGRI